MLIFVNIFFKHYIQVVTLTEEEEKEEEEKAKKEKRKGDDDDDDDDDDVDASSEQAQKIGILHLLSTAWDMYIDYAIYKCYIQRILREMQIFISYWQPAAPSVYLRDFLATRPGQRHKKWTRFLLYAKHKT